MAGSGSRRPVAMAQVARAAGVSVTTVSHVVNRTRSVAPETERAVLAAIAETGYVPDSIVRSQRTVGTRTVGLALSAMSNMYFADLVHSIEQTLAAAGYSMLLADTHDEVVDELRVVSDLLTRRVDAILLAPSADPRRALGHARKQGVPVVLIDRTASAHVDQVVAESKEATASLVDHLVSRGHSRIAMISGKPGLSTTEERIQGYREGLKRNGLRFSSALMVSGNSTDEGAQLAFAELLKLPVRPSALVVGNNVMTLGVMRAARRAGITVPGDLALVGYDDFPWADLFRPGLTVVAQPTEAMGREAAQMVLARLADSAHPVRRVVMRTTFVHRESCGCPLDS
ncbi:MAG TPA: LacI family DNA-binding transcriptional regulator [Nocardioidaceae bacterium]|nr:LacI family DNA-binding transcriptional regulator [Nocardioidaceae bacterium]